MQSDKKKVKFSFGLIIIYLLCHDKKSKFWFIHSFQSIPIYHSRTRPLIQLGFNVANSWRSILHVPPKMQERNDSG